MCVQCLYNYFSWEQHLTFRLIFFFFINERVINMLLDSFTYLLDWRDILNRSCCCNNILLTINLKIPSSRIELMKERERQKEAEVEALKRSMQSGMVWKFISVYFWCLLLVFRLHDGNVPYPYWELFIYILYFFTMHFHVMSAFKNWNSSL